MKKSKEDVEEVNIAEKMRGKSLRWYFLILILIFFNFNLAHKKLNNIYITKTYNYIVQEDEEIKVPKVAKHKRD